MEDPSTKSEEKPKQPEFIPSKYAKQSCKQCGGRGIFRVHIPTPIGRGKTKVIPKANNTATKPCGCATKRYLKKVRGY